ncbi:MAG TPA: chemotaxis protein CheW, partial [Blastocatellia bacterium]|nr:chemotaxis protein CheW [Blastocatellia bacterium]
MTKRHQETKKDRERLSQSLLIELPHSEAEGGTPGGLSLLVFGIGDEKFAIEVDHTEGVVDCPRLTPLPSPPDGMIGITSVRGRMTLVLELGSETGQKPSKRRLILLRDAQLGLIADHIEGIVSLDTASKARTRKRAAASSPRTLDRKEILPVLS